MVRILAVSDEEELYKDFPNTDSFENIDILVSCGDLSPGYLEYVIHKTMPPYRLMVHGNHDKLHFPFDYVHENQGYSDIYKGMYVLNAGLYTITKEDAQSYDIEGFGDKDLVIGGFSGAYAHGEQPFFFDDKHISSFIRSMKLKDFFWGFDSPMIMLSHCAPSIDDFFDDIDHFHKASERLADIAYSFFPKLWFYGHIHPRSSSQKLDFKIDIGQTEMYLLNATPYKIVDFDISLGHIDISPMQHKYF